MASVCSYFTGPEELEDTNHARSLLKELKLFYDCKLLVDVTIEVESSELCQHAAPGNSSSSISANGTGKLFSCNRNVLAAASPYFKSMFTGGLYESKQKKVTIHDVDAESMSLIIDYCYTGKVTISEGNVQRLYASANMLQLEYVRQACSSFMARRLDLSNCAGILKFADAFDNHDLKGKARAFIARNFQHFCKKGRELCELSLSQVKEILALDTLDVDSEMKVCSVAIQWIEANMTEKVGNALEVLKCIRWHHFTEKERVYIEGLKSKPFIKKQCLEILQGVTGATCSEVTASSENPAKRIGMSAKEMIIFFGQPKEPFLCYDPYAGEIFTMVSPLTNLAIDTFAVCVSPENDLYLASQHSKHLWIYNAVQNNWTELEQRLLDRTDMDIGYLNGNIYILGGRDPLTSARLKEVECYNIQRNQWRLVAPLPHSLGKIEIVTVNDHLYVVSNKRMLCLEPERNQWLNCASLKRPEFQEACVFQEQIFCICDIPVMKVYSPARGEWRRIGDIPVDGNTSNYQIVRHGNKLMLITTTLPHRNKNRVTIHEYNPSSDQWINMGTMLGLLHYAFSYGFICLTARIYPTCLESGQNFVTEEDDDRSGSSADWDFEGLSDADSESGSSSSFSEDENW
ncbi:kelch repeat and BTB domain-containing protein 7-like [Polyodon spathula]|uniref:kelch repeat and BTB domain-containing protein 7-like n=1 Tax=Polyodon spathula TaxID=7913 RepID=UPI001B7E944A|nr:kelch repeat and BTB domain-containing protein 7-like [Polyodon spathula]